jgi:mono/diheme cytochrome c family protein
MKIHTLLLVGLAVVGTGCAEKEQGSSMQDDAAASSAESMPVVEAANMGEDAFIEHMHVHAEQLGKINTALSFGNLEAAQTPSYWLSRHEGVTGPLYDWEDYLDQMRTAAGEIADASDLATARAAARRIAASCQACHAAAGVEVLISSPDPK